jgi:hypothetical protein
MEDKFTVCFFDLQGNKSTTSAAKKIVVQRSQLIDSALFVAITLRLLVALVPTTALTGCTAASRR